MAQAVDFGLLVLCGTMMGCGARPLPPAAVAGATRGSPPAADASFARGLEAMVRHEHANDWSEVSCKETEDLLLAGAPKPAARYDAGLVERRCKREGRAKALFEAALAQDPAFYPARAALAIALAKEPGGRERAIAELTRSVRDARFGDVDALVALATLQTQRGSSSADEEGADDFSRARRNLQRALAIEDTSMPALNALALVYLAQAQRASAASGGGKGATQALELAALVCSQAIQKNPRWAPIHNTAGLVEIALGNLSRAAASFEEARRLDPRLVEAQMNVASLNLEVRGFARAEEAYRAVLALEPESYDAHLGLAVAIRGQLEGAGDPERVAAAAHEIEAAKRIAPERSEAYFNEAILVQEYGGRSAAPGEAMASLARAKGLYEQFLAKADGAPALAVLRQRAEGRLQDIRDMTEGFKATVPAP